MRGLWAAWLISAVVSMPWPHVAVGTEAVRKGRVVPAAATVAGQARQPGDGARQVVYRLDFSEFTGGSVEDWLESKGFKLRDAAKNPEELGLSIIDGALKLEAKTQLRGFIYNDSLHIEPFSAVRLEWGVTKFPEGASYEKHLRNEALMVYFSFGDHKISSGSLIMPNLPYFIGLFLCKADNLNVPYLGAYYHTGGRFVCVGHPQPNETVVSEFDLRSAFRTYFDITEAPYISGINLGVDTSASGGGGTAGAFIKRIEVLK
jgi:hypothetical protein